MAREDTVQRRVRLRDGWPIIRNENRPRVVWAVGYRADDGTPFPVSRVFASEALARAHASEIGGFYTRFVVEREEGAADG